MENAWERSCLRENTRVSTRSEETVDAETTTRPARGRRDDRDRLWRRDQQRLAGGLDAGGKRRRPRASESAGASASPAAELADEQVLRVTLGSEDPDTLDPSKASTSIDIGVLHALNRGLIYFDKDLNPVPSLADRAPRDLG